MKRALTGIQPSGEQHIGNLLGAILPALSLTDKWESYYFIASYHALTTSRDGVELRERIRRTAAVWLAMGLDPSRTVLWAQQDVPEVCELAWILSCVTSKGMLDKAHAFKDAVNKKKKFIGVGLYTYPMLMAADILAFDSNVVPVGRDQKQHVEMAKDMAQRFNHHYGDILVLPEPHIQDEVATIPGTDGKKMSKSYGNTIPIFLPPKKLRKRIMSITTDSTPMEDPKDPTSCVVFNLYRRFATAEQTEALADRYRSGGMGYGHAKQDLFEVINTQMEAPRERFHDLLTRPDDIQDILNDGAFRARSVASATLDRVRVGTGL